jgi:hypothetical protein
MQIIKMKYIIMFLFATIVMSISIRSTNAADLTHYKLSETESITLSQKSDSAGNTYVLRFVRGSEPPIQLWEQRDSDADGNTVKLTGITAAAHNGNDVTLAFSLDDFIMLVVQANLADASAASSRILVSELMKKQSEDPGKIHVVGPGAIQFTNPKAGVTQTLTRLANGTFQLDGIPYPPSSQTLIISPTH